MTFDSGKAISRTTFGKTNPLKAADKPAKQKKIMSQHSSQNIMGIN